MRVIVRNAARTLLAALTFVVAGCGAGSSTAPGGVPLGTFNELLAMIDRAVIPGAILPPNADSTAAFLGALNVEGLRAGFGLFPTYISPTVVQFSDAGAVSIRTVASGGETTLDRQQLIVSGFTMNVYSTLPSHPAGFVLAFDGTTQHRFTVSGASSVTAFVDSVRSVSLPVVVTPAAGATVPRASNLDITWTPMGSDTAVYVAGLLVSEIDTTLSAAVTLARDVDGSSRIDSARLATLPIGAARLSLARYRIVRRDAGARRINLISQAVTLRTVELQ